MKFRRVSSALPAGVFVVAFLVAGTPQITLGQAKAGRGTWMLNVGTFKLNVAKSKYDPGPPPKSQTRTYTPIGDDGQYVAVSGADENGKHVAYSYGAKFDGKDYPLEGSGIPSAADTIALKRIDDYTNEATLKKAGKIVLTTRTVISKDGKTRTQTSKGTTASGQPMTNVMVFDRQ